MYSVTITVGNVSKDTWHDWYLIPTSRPVINPPAPKTKYVDIPGRSGSLDLSQWLTVSTGHSTGYPTYENRSGSLEFIVSNHNIDISGRDDDWNWVDFDIPDVTWISVYQAISNFLHGQEAVLVLSDDPDYSYLGRLTLISWKSEEKYSTITLDYNLAPFKSPDGSSASYYSMEEGGVL